MESEIALEFERTALRCSSKASAATVSRGSAARRGAKAGDAVRPGACCAGWSHCDRRSKVFRVKLGELLVIALLAMAWALTLAVGIPLLTAAQREQYITQHKSETNVSVNQLQVAA
jgi:hypothetical protein